MEVAEGVRQKRAFERPKPYGTSRRCAVSLSRRPGVSLSRRPAGPMRRF